MVIVPATAVPVKLNVSEVELLKVTPLAVNVVVPTEIVNIDSDVGVSKSVPVTSIVGFD